MSLTKASYSIISGSTVNVLDYGASPGASSAVNGAAFEAALTYLQNNTGTYQLGGGILTVPEGIYAIDRPLTIGLYTVMQGYGPLTTYLVFDSTVTTSDIFIGPSTQPGNTYGYTYASGLRNIAIKGGGNEDHIIYSAGMHQFSVIENVSVKFVNTFKNLNFNSGVILYLKSPLRLGNLFFNSSIVGCFLKPNEV